MQSKIVKLKNKGIPIEIKIINQNSDLILICFSQNTTIDNKHIIYFDIEKWEEVKNYIDLKIKEMKNEKEIF